MIPLRKNVKRAKDDREVMETEEEENHSEDGGISDNSNNPNHTVLITTILGIASFLMITSSILIKNGSKKNKPKGSSPRLPLITKVLTLFISLPKKKNQNFFFKSWALAP